MRKDRTQNLVSEAPAPATLSPREIETLVGLAAGDSNHDIAAALRLSVKTIDTHRGNLLCKLQLRGNADLARYALRHSLIDFDGCPQRENVADAIAAAQERRSPARAEAPVAPVEPVNPGMGWNP